MATRKSSPHSAEELIPLHPTLNSLRAAAADCKACDLWKLGTQTVFGEGRRRSMVMFIGTSPIYRRPQEISEGDHLTPVTLFR
jgi:DNA polymerase